MLLGLGGNDILVGKSLPGGGLPKEWDVLDGGEGDDQITGSFGAAILAGGIGHDIVGGGDGNEAIFGGLAPVDIEAFFSTSDPRTVLEFVL